jgi:two-component system LytT family response regulator
MLRVLIVDDEAPARKRLRKLLTDLDADDLTIVGEAEDGVDALEQLREQDVDLVFLDIRMPELDGFDVLERLAPDERPVVVFTTAYDAYAVRAFEANAVDYLLKPIGKERLAEAIGRARRLRRTPETRQLNDERLGQLLDWIDARQEQQQEQDELEERTFLDQISVPYRDRILIIPTDDLVTAEINEGITRLFVRTDDDRGPHPKLRQHVVSYTLDQLESNLDPDAFVRVHRSSIVHLKHIKEMIPWFSGRYKLIMTGDHEVIASRERSKKLKSRLML